MHTLILTTQPAPAALNPKPAAAAAAPKPPRGWLVALRQVAETLATYR